MIKVKTHQMAKAEEYSRSDHELFAVKVIDNVEISPGVFLLTWRQNGTFIPGQVVKVAIDRLQRRRRCSVCGADLEVRISSLSNTGGQASPAPTLADAI